MANRSIIYDEEQVDPFDILWQFKDFLAAIGAIETDLAGQTTTVVTGFTPTATSPASLSINLTKGRIYQQSVIDATAYGALPSDASIVQQQGVAPAQSVTLTTADLSSGQSKWALVQAQFSQLDQVRVGDPTGGVLNYFNTANPAQPFEGPNNDGASQPTERAATVAIQVIYGAPAATGSEAPPNPTNGWVPLYLVDLTFAQGAITSGQVLVAGPSVGSNVPNNYPGAPFLSGLLNQHHRGTPGQAPQIDLTDEVKNTLALANLPASSASGGGIAVLKLHAGNPNGNVAGNFNVNGALDFCVDTIGQLLYFCSASGTASTAVWTSVSGATTSIFAGGTATGTVNAQIVASTTPTGFTKSPGQVVTFTGLNNTGSTTLNIDGTGTSTVQKNTAVGNTNLTGGELNGFATVVWTGTIYLLQSGLLGQLSTLNIGKFLTNDGAGNLTVKTGANLGDDGSGNLEVPPGFLPPVATVLDYAAPPSAATPTGFLVCGGQAVSRATFAALFAVIGINYGGGDGVTTFNVPDLRGRVVAGNDDMGGGVPAGRLSSVTLSPNGVINGATGGTETETLILNQIPPGITSSGSNTISVSGSNTINVTGALSNADVGITPSSSGGGSFGFNAVAALGTAFAASGVNTISASGANSISVTSNNTSGLAHPNVQPTMIMSKIIKT
jgi:microcystin-dependent protein